MLHSTSNGSTNGTTTNGATNHAPANRCARANDRAFRSVSDVTAHGFFGANCTTNYATANGAANYATANGATNHGSPSYVR